MPGDAADWRTRRATHPDCGPSTPGAPPPLLFDDIEGIAALIAESDENRLDQCDESQGPVADLCQLLVPTVLVRDSESLAK